MDFNKNQLAATTAAKGTLEGFASLPADTFSEGPPTGEGISANGRTGPFTSPPIQGFSGVQFAPDGDGSNYWFLSDNGFGSKANSSDYLLRIYQIAPNLGGSPGGDGSAAVQGFVQLSDPNHLIPFDIQTEGSEKRHLTGSDFDVESFVIDRKGDIWIGEEFGPHLLHFNSMGQLVEAPIATPNVTDIKAFLTGSPTTGAAAVETIHSGFVHSPDSPAVLAGEAEANLGGSRGFEGLAFSPDRGTLYPMLEGTVSGDPKGSLRIYEFDVASSSFTGIAGLYQMEAGNHAIGDFTPINADEFLVIERDSTQSTDATFKQIFKVDLSNIDEDGFVAKQLVVDLLNIADPNDLNGDGKTTFDFPFVTIENVLVLDEDSILVANDNNYPFSIGRDLSGQEIDSSDIIEIKLNTPLEVAPELGTAGFLRMALTMLF